jgi:hypothetical protein
VTSTEASQRVAAHALQVEIPMVAVGEGGLQGCGGGWPPGCPRYDCMGGRQKPGPQGGQNHAEGGGGHVGGAPGARDPPVHCGPGA